MFRCLQALGDQVMVIKLSEVHPLHPAQSRNGLWELARMFRGHDLTLVRTVRDPMEVVESFLTARLPEAQEAPLAGLAKNSDGDICQWIQEESTSVMIQRPMLAEETHCTLIEMRYELLGNPAGKRELLEHFPESDLLVSRLGEFGRTPVRDGRLKRGLGIVSTDEEREYFSTHLKTVITREGY